MEKYQLIARQQRRVGIDEEATDRPAGAEREAQITCFQIAGTYFAPGGHRHGQLHLKLDKIHCRNLPFECLAVVVAAVVATSSYATVIRQYWYYSN